MHDPGGRRHSRQHLSLALIRRDRDPHSGLENSDALDATRRVWLDALRDCRSQYLAPKALLRTKGGDRIPGEPEDDRMLSKLIDRPVGDAEGWKPDWPNLELAFTPIGKANIVQAGRDLTVVTYGRSVAMCVQASEEAGGSVEVIDLRTLAPYDWDCIRESVRKTHRVLFVNEETEITNFGEHLIRRTCDELFYELHAAPRLLAGAHVPGIGLADNLERASIPQKDTIAAAMRELIKHQP
jgi:2-oxoisovalerate dehydrogenase E1 component beta subunit